MAWFDSFQHFDTFILSTAFVKSAVSSAIYLQYQKVHDTYLFSLNNSYIHVRSPNHLLRASLEPKASGVGGGCTNKEAKDCSH